MVEGQGRHLAKVGRECLLLLLAVERVVAAHDERRAHRVVEDGAPDFVVRIPLDHQATAGDEAEHVAVCEEQNQVVELGLESGSLDDLHGLAGADDGRVVLWRWHVHC